MNYDKSDWIRAALAPAGIHYSGPDRAGNDAHLFAKPGLRKITIKPRMPDHQVRETADRRRRFYYRELAHCLNTLSKSSRDCDDQVCVEDRQRCRNEERHNQGNPPS